MFLSEASLVGVIFGQTLVLFFYCYTLYNIIH